uniref:C-type lectin domain-containing protein n=1 Tax=Ditylenchus dipsaci TaxID=166011 RepID=A0A915E349_9BILA
MLEEHSHLASVHSYEENEYIASLLNVAPRKNACSFSNVDGSDTFFVPTTFQKGLYPWADRRSNRQGDPEAEPNNDGKKGPENCTEMIVFEAPVYAGKSWNDFNCENQRIQGAICKKAAGRRPLKC